MRVFVFLIIGFLILAVVFTAVIFIPDTQQQSVQISKIDLNRQPQPVVKSDPGGDYILEFFPEPSAENQDSSLSDALIDAPPSAQKAIYQPDQNINSTDVQMELDKNRMLALIDDWVYTDYIEVGQTKQGTIKRSRENISFSIYEGEDLNNGIKIATLTSDVALLQLGEATFNLRRARQPSFFSDVKREIRPLTPEEQEQAYEYYMRVYGDKFKEMSRNYKPPNGMPKPRQVSQEEQQKALDTYMKQYGSQFKQESANYKPQFYYNQDMRKAYDKYWQQFHGGENKPSFDDAFANQAASGPDARLVPAELLQQRQ